MPPSARKQLIHWVLWFYLINTIFSLSIQLGYLHLLPDLHAVYGATWGRIVLAWFFLLASYITQATLINYLCCALVLSLILCVPRYHLVSWVAIFLAALINLAQIIDVLTFRLFHTHNLSLGVSVFKARAFTEVFPMSSTEIALMVFVFGGFLLLEWGVAYLVWRRIALRKRGYLGYYWAVFLGLVLLFSYSMMASILTFPPNYRLNEHNARLLIKVSRFVPFYNELYTLLVPGSERYVRHFKTHGGEVSMQMREENKPLTYPQQGLTCRADLHPLNIVYLVIDTWRYDAMTEKITPHIHDFSQRALQYQDHYSGGNCTQPGIFTLFYGLPANYWRAMREQKKGPIFIQELMKQHYQLGIFASATLRFPEFNKTVFQEVPHLLLSTPGDTSIDRDKAITKRFKDFILHRDVSRPFFSFVFYDAAHNYCGGGEGANQKPFEPAIKACERFNLNNDTNPAPYLNRYHNAVHFIDQEIGKDLALLSDQGLLDHTIVLITADHGEEFDDEKLNYWSHASAYTPYQLQVPFLLWWPGHSPQTISSMTTHYELTPTVMKEVLHCDTSARTYSLGGSLFERRTTPYLLASSYSDYAALTPHEVIRVYPDGDFVINYPNGHLKPKAELNVPLMNAVYRDLQHFFPQKQ